MLTRLCEDSKKQWVSKLSQWGLKKNIGTKEMQKIGSIQQKRKLDDQKETRFTIRGRPVLQENIERWQKRQKFDPSQLSQQRTTIPNNSQRVVMANL